MTKHTVLYVEDDPSFRAIIQVKFGSHYNLLTASNALEAIRILTKEDVDLVLTDMMMPGMDGADLVTIIFSRFPKVKCILLTGFPESKKCKELNEKTPVRIITKSTSLTIIKNIIDQDLETDLFDFFATPNC